MLSNLRLIELFSVDYIIILLYVLSVSDIIDTFIHTIHLVISWSTFIDKTRKIYAILLFKKRNTPHLVCYESNSCFYLCFSPISFNFLTFWWFLSERESYSTLNGSLPSDVSNWEEEYISDPKSMTQRIIKITLILYKKY